MICKTCKLDKSVDDYRIRNDNKRPRSACKSCESKYQVSYRNKNIKKRKEYERKYKRSIEGKFVKLKAAAKSRNLPMLLDFNTFKLLHKIPCHYCGENFERTTGYGIDRINSDLGYTKENSVACCSKCNYAKQSLEYYEFISHIIKIVNNTRKNIKYYGGIMGKELSEAQAWKHIVGLFGDDNVFHPEEIENVEIIRTRSPGLDRALGVGGWPRGRLIQLAGAEASGKTFMAMMAMAEWQSQDPENCCAFLDAEFTYDPVWAESLGIDNDRVFLVKSNQAHEIFTGLIGKYKKNKNTGKITSIPGLLEMIQQGMVIKHKVDDRVINLNLAKMGVIVLDSIVAMQTPMETESDVGKQNIAPVARFLSAELKKLTPLIAHANVALIAINQVRVNVGQMFGNPETTSGGKALKHACSVMAEVAAISGKDNTITDEHDDKIGHRVRAKISKNKLAPPHKRAEFWTHFGQGVVRTKEELLDIGCLYGLIERPNNRSYIIGEDKLTSRDEALGYIRVNKLKIEEDIRAIYTTSNGVNITKEDEVEEIETVVLDNPFEME